MKKQGLDCGCVCVFDEGLHDLTSTADNVLRDIFHTFFHRPNRIHQLDAVWSRDSTLSEQIEVKDRREGGAQGAHHHPRFGGLLHLRVKKSPYPQTITPTKEHTLRMLESKANHSALTDHSAIHGAESALLLRGQKILHSVLLCCGLVDC